MLSISSIAKPKLKTGRLKRRTKIAVLALIFFGLIGFASRVEFSYGAISGTQIQDVFINGNKATFSTNIIIDDSTGAIYAPVIELFENLNIKMTYKEAPQNRYVGTFNDANIAIPLDEDFWIFDTITIDLKGKTIKDNNIDMFDITYLGDVYGVDMTLAPDNSSVTITTELLDRRTLQQKNMAALNTDDGISILNDPTTVARMCNEGQGAWCGWGGESYPLIQTNGIELPAGEYPCDDDERCKLAYNSNSMDSFANGWTSYGPDMVFNSSAKLQMKESDIGIISFWARATDVRDALNEPMVNVYPTHTTSSTHIPITYEWKKYYVPFRLSSGQTGANLNRVTLRSGSRDQNIQITRPQAFAYDSAGLNYGDFYEDLSVSERYIGQESDALWREVANRRIEKYRKNLLSVTIKDSDGNIIPNADIKIEMTKNDFKFGTAVHGSLVSTSAYALDYQDKLRENFNSITSENAFKWENYYSAQDLITRRSEPADRVPNFAIANDMSVRGHTILWDSSGHFPTRDKFDVLGNGTTNTLTWGSTGNVTKDDASKLLRAHIDDILGAYYNDPHYRDNPVFYEWDVQNEPFSQSNGGLLRTSRGFGNDWVAENLFCYIRENFPQVHQVINDYNLTDYESYGDYNTKRFLNLLKSYESYSCSDGNKVKIDGIGLQYYPTKSHYRTFNPQKYYNNLVRLSDTVSTVQLTEYAAGGTAGSLDNMKVATDFLEDIVRATFSMPKASGFTLWGFYNNNTAYQNQNLIFNTLGEPQAGYYIWNNLQDEWSTNVESKTNTSGNYDIRAFRGEYEITASYGAESKTIKASVRDIESNNITITLGSTVSSSTKLSSLTVKNYTLSPTFNPDTTEYYVAVLGNINMLDIEAVPEDAATTITITGNQSFSVGSNEVTIKVAANDGPDSTTYKINVTKTAPTDTRLASLSSIPDYALSPAFDSDITTYSMTIPATLTSIDFSFSPFDANVSHTITGNTNLQTGSNEVRLRITANDGTGFTLYTIFVIKSGQTWPEPTAPQLTDITYSIPTSVTYNGSPQPIATPTAASGVTGLGSITVRYAGTGGTTYPESTTAPTDTGSYTVYADIAEGTSYTAAKLTLGTHVIVKANVTSASQEFAVKAQVAHTYTFDLRALLPSGVSASAVSSYAVASISNDIFTTTPSISGYILTLPVASTAAGDAKSVITVSFTSANYNITTAGITINVADRTPVNISGVSVTGRAYNGSPIAATGTPIFTDTISQAVVTTLAPVYTWKTSTDTILANAPTDAGSYKLVVSADGGIDYEVADLEIGFVISKANQTITFICPASGYIGDMITLSASISTGLSGITFASQDTTIATVAGNILTLLGEGTVTVTASHPGNANYVSASSNCNISISDPDYTITQAFADFNGIGPRFAIINARFSEFERLTLDGEDVSPEHYAVTEGSTVITLSEAYLKSLATGTHTFVAQFMNNRQVDLNIIILSNTRLGLPGTGFFKSIADSGYVSIISFVLTGGAAGIIVTRKFLGRRKRITKLKR